MNRYTPRRYAPVDARRSVLAFMMRLAAASATQLQPQRRCWSWRCRLDDRRPTAAAPPSRGVWPGRVAVEPRWSGRPRCTDCKVLSAWTTSKTQAAEISTPTTYLSARY